MRARAAADEGVVPRRHFRAGDGPPPCYNVPLGFHESVLGAITCQEGLVDMMTIILLLLPLFNFLSLNFLY